MIKAEKVPMEVVEKIKLRYIKHREKHGVEKSIKRVLSENPQFSVANLLTDFSKVAEIRIVLYKVLMTFPPEEITEVMIVLSKEYPGLMEPLK